MTVAVLVKDLNVRGGTHKQVLRLCQYLQSQNMDVTAFTKWYEAEKTYPEFQDVNVESLYGHDWHKPKTASGLAGKILNKISVITHDFADAVRMTSRVLKIKPTVVNIHDSGFEKEILFLKLLSPKTKIVWQINDLPSCFHVGMHEGGKDSFREKYRRKFICAAAKNVDQITVNVTKNKERVEKCMNKSAQVFYCGVDVNDKLDMHTFNVREGGVNLLSTGVFYPHRNYEILVLTVEELKKRGAKLHLNIIGATDRAPEYSAKIIGMIKERNLEDEITIWGQVDEEEYARLYNGADIFAFINVNQSWGLAVFEAMSCGLPVLVSNSVGAIELLHDQEDSVIVDPENVGQISDSILKLAGDPGYYNKLSANAIAAVKEFTWDKLYSEKMLALFVELLEKNQ